MIKATDDVTLELNRYLQMLHNSPSMLKPMALAHISFKTRYAAAIQHEDFPHILETVLEEMEQEGVADSGIVDQIMKTSNDIVSDEFVCSYMNVELAMKFATTGPGVLAKEFPQFRKESPFRDVRTNKPANNS